jgi:hypothetical protein
MAAPTLQAEGSISANTNGSNLSPTIPAHVADDILVVQWIKWAPNTGAGNWQPVGVITSNWTEFGRRRFPASGDPDGWIGASWIRATGSGHTVTITDWDGSSLPAPDTGADTVFSARAYVIRGCGTNGNPYDQFVVGGAQSVNNGVFSAVTVAGNERTVIHFGAVTDNLSFSMASTGWANGTEVNSGTGTDSAFQTAFKEDISASTSSDTATVTAPAAGFYVFIGVSFSPPFVASNPPYRNPMIQLLPH